LDDSNGGIIRDLTESGITVQCVAPLRPGQEVRLRFDLLSPRVRVEAHGWVAWAQDNGQGGIHFSGLPRRMQLALRDWLFTQLLSAATISARDTIFEDARTHLSLSTATRPSILLQPAKPAEVETAPVHWGVLSFSQRAFSIFVDSLVLACAVLLFSVSCIIVMGGFPAWPLATALFFTSTTIFIATYQLLFSDFLCGATPGRRLAKLASQPAADESMQRFR
jgi:hypothetical protein